MTKPKVEVDPVLAAAMKAKADAEKARAKANRSATAVKIATKNLADHVLDAAEHHLEADAAEKKAAEHKTLAADALNKALGPAHEEEHHEEHHDEDPATEAPKAKE